MAERDTLNDVLILHQVYLQYYINNLTKSWQEYIKTLESNINATVYMYTDIPNKVYSKQRLLGNVKDALDDFEKNVKKQVEKDMRELSRVENDFYATQLDSFLSEFDLDVNKESSNKMYDAVSKKKLAFKNGEVYTILALLNQFLADTRKRLLSQIENAYLLEVDERELRASLTGNTGQTHVSYIRLGAVAATLAAFYSSEVRDRNYRINSDKIIGYEWQSILDSRTSEFCRWADGKVYYYEDGSGDLGGPITPPAHNRCRSHTAPIFAKYSDIGLDKSYADVFSGKPSGKETYYQWLDRQKASVQKDVLGPTRYNMWKSGEITPDKFYNRNGNYLTLAQLEQKGFEIPNIIK